MKKEFNIVKRGDMWIEEIRFVCEEWSPFWAVGNNVERLDGGGFEVTDKEGATLLIDETPLGEMDYVEMLNHIAFHYPEHIRTWAIDALFEIQDYSAIGYKDVTIGTKWVGSELYLVDRFDPDKVAITTRETILDDLETFRERIKNSLVLIDNTTINYNLFLFSYVNRMIRDKIERIKVGGHIFGHYVERISEDDKFLWTQKNDEKVLIDLSLNFLKKGIEHVPYYTKFFNFVQNEYTNGKLVEAIVHEYEGLFR